MHMMQMTGIVLFFYFFSLALICLYRDKINTKIFNVVFVVTDLIFFFCWNYSYYLRGALEGHFLTFDNISPMTFTMIGLLYFMKDSVRESCLSSIAFLSFGMFCAMLISPEQAYLVNFNQEATFMYTSEAFCHMLASLFGVYLVVTRQIKVDFEHLIKGGIFLYSVITFGVFLNYVFHKDFFGMDPYGDYGIYFMDIFGSFEVTLVAYYVGVLLVLILGWQVSHLFVKLTTHKQKQIKTGSLIDPDQDKTELSEDDGQLPVGEIQELAKEIAAADGQENGK